MTHTLIQKSIQRLAKAALLVVSLAGVSGCGDSTVGVSITGYNHSKVHPIYIYSVNGAPGSNLNQESGGGKHSCCVSLPKRWTPGLKAKVFWDYDSDVGDPTPRPPPQEVEVDIPEYKRPAGVQIHFYDEHQVKVVISDCSIEHPFYPMTPQEKLPWEDFTTKEEALESQRNGGMTNDC